MENVVGVTQILEVAQITPWKIVVVIAVKVCLVVVMEGATGFVAIVKIQGVRFELTHSILIIMEIIYFFHRQ